MGKHALEVEAELCEVFFVVCVQMQIGFTLAGND